MSPDEAHLGEAMLPAAKSDSLMAVVDVSPAAVPFNCRPSIETIEVDLKSLVRKAHEVERVATSLDTAEPLPPEQLEALERQLEMHQELVRLCRLSGHDGKQAKEKKRKDCEGKEVVEMEEIDCYEYFGSTIIYAVSKGCSQTRTSSTAMTSATSAETW